MWVILDVDVMYHLSIDIVFVSKDVTTNFRIKFLNFLLTSKLVAQYWQYGKIAKCNQYWFSTE